MVDESSVKLDTRSSVSLYRPMNLGLRFSTKERKDPVAPTTCATPIEAVSEFAAGARAAWARLIRKVYEANPLECPKCHGPMRIIALINDQSVVRRILEHLALWQPEAMERSPPVPPEAWPANASFALTYHPVPDIA